MNLNLRTRRAGPVACAVLIGAAFLVTGCVLSSGSNIGQSDQDHLNSRVQDVHRAWDRFLAEVVPCPEGRPEVFAACFEAGYRRSDIEPATVELSQLLERTRGNVDNGACRESLIAFQHKLDQFHERLVVFEQDVAGLRPRDAIAAAAATTRARLDEAIRLQNASVSAC